MNKSEYRKRQDDAEHKRREAADDAYRDKIINSLQAISEQNKTADNQAKRADRFHRIVERLTLRLEKRKYWIEIAETGGLWFAATVGVVAIIISTRDAREQRDVMQGQLSEMRESAKQTRQLVVDNARLTEAAGKQADAAQKQAAALAESVQVARDNLITAQRAWVGPLNAQSAAPALGKDLKIFLSYQNTGREPALQTTINFDVFTFEEDNAAASALATQRINSFIDGCKIAWNPGAAQVVFPNVGGFGSAYNSSKTLSGAQVDQQVMDGNKSIIIDGCFVYLTSQKASHFSSFCYFFTAKITDPAHWNICRAGNDAN